MPLLDIQVEELGEYLQAGEKKTVRVTVIAPASNVYPVRVTPVDTIPDNNVELDTSMLPSNLILNPGDTCILGLDITFTEPGRVTLEEIELQTVPIGGPDYLSERISLGAIGCNVLPSLARQLAITTRLICRYGEAVKVAIDLEHKGADELHMVMVSVGPTERLRSGVTRRVYDKMSLGRKESNEFVVVGENIDVDVQATWREEQLRHHVTLQIPDVPNEARHFTEFRFLQPRNLTTDRILIRPDYEHIEIIPTGGIFSVYGGNARYFVTIVSDKANVTELKLLPAPGVEVNPVKEKGMQFEITVVENPVIRQTVRLLYTMTAGGKHYQSEIYLNIVPTKTKLFHEARTQGWAVTLAGLAVVVPPLFRHDDASSGIFDHLVDLIEKRFLNFLMVLSIPLIWVALWLLNLTLRQFDDA